MFWIVVPLIIGAIAFVASTLLKTKILTPKQVQELLNEKVVIVTGAARGLGKSLAEEFLRKGSKVVIVDLKEDLLEQVKKEMIAISSADRVVSISGDLSKKTFCKEVIDTTIAKFGKLDILFSNHGIFPVKPLDDVSVEDIEQVLQVNFLGAVYLSKYATEHLKKTKGSIAVTSSMAGKIAIRKCASYCASKHAMLGFFDTMRVELSNHGVQVTVICPGGMRTDMIKEAYGTYTPNEKIKFYLPEELTPAIVEAVAARKREHYTEGFLRILGLLRALFPQSIDNFLDKLH